MDEKRKNKGLKITLTAITLGFFLMSSGNAQTDEQGMESFRKVISRAEEFYNRAVISYEKGDSGDAEKFYMKAMQKFQQAKLGADINYRLKEEFDNLFAGIDGIFQEMNGDSVSSLEVSEEELKELEEVKEPEEIEAGKKYTIPIEPDDRLVKKYIALYTGRSKKPIQEALERSGMYRDMILKILRENGLPEELVYLPVVESLYKVNAYSKARAVGLWQFMSGTGRSLGLKINYWIDERKDPEKSTRAAAKYLKQLYEWFEDWHLALAAYNRGEVGIGKDLKFSKATDFKALQDTNAIPLETNRFVPKFMACTIIGDNYSEYGFVLDFKKPLEYDEVELEKVIDLEVIAKCVDSKVSDLKKLNPSLKAWCTPKNYPKFKLKLPAGSGELFRENIAQVKNLTPTRGFVKYRVRKGDVLVRIARKYRTTVASIKKSSGLRNANRLRIGQELTINPGREYSGG